MNGGKAVQGDARLRDHAKSPPAAWRVLGQGGPQPSRGVRAGSHPTPHPSSSLQVNVFGFGADSRGNWHHYWENNRYAGEFRKTGVHDADFEAHIIDMLAKTSKIEVYRGN